MAGRQTFIELELKTDKVKNGIATVLAGLKSIQTEVDKINKNQINLIKTDNQQAQILSLTQAVAKLSKAYYELKASSKGAEKDIESTFIAFARLQTSMLAIDYTLRSFSNIGQKIKSFTSIESNISNLAIASNKGTNEIRGLMNEFLSLTASIPKSAEELVRVTDALVRTGRSYKEALEITKETAKLAVATGEDLEHTAKTVSKVMVALQINSEKTSEVLNILHSTAIQTASSMESISGGMNQVAGALGAIAQSSARSGKELAEYKKQLLEVGAVGLGVMNNLGKSASELVE